MTKKAFEKIAAGAKDALRIARGEESMVERVAATLYLHRKQNYIDQARAAIEAMREPTEKMAAVFGYAGECEPSESLAAAYWQDMIDEALK